MEAESLDGVVHDDGLAEVSAEAVQVFDENAGEDLRAVLAVQAVREELILRVEELHTGVRVGFLKQGTGSARLQRALATTYLCGCK